MSHDHRPSFAPSAASASRSASLQERGLICDVVPQQHGAVAVWQDIDLDDPVARRGCQDQVPDDAHARGLHGVDDRVRQFGPGHAGDCAGDRAAQRVFGPTAEQVRERVVPARDPAGAVHGGDTHVQRRDHAAPGILAIRVPEVGAVGPAGEAQRDRRRRQDAPRVAADRGDDRDGDGRPDDVAGTAAQPSRRPPAVVRLPRHEWRDQAVRRARDETISRHRRRNRHTLPRPLERSGRPAERRVGEARGLGGHGNGGNAQQSSRRQQGPPRGGQSGGDRRNGGNEGHRLRAEKKHRGERGDKPQRHGRAACRFGQPRSEHGGRDRRQRQGEHPGNAVRLPRPTSKPEREREAARCCRGDDGERQRARRNGDSWRRR